MQGETLWSQLTVNIICFSEKKMIVQNHGSIFLEKTIKLLTVLLSFYAKLDVIVVLYPLWPVVHMLTLDVWLESNRQTDRRELGNSKYYF